VRISRVPILYIDGEPKIGQSKAIERFLAKQFGLYGANDVEGGQIDMLGEHVRPRECFAGRT
jgi:glutathione S-transferase